MSSSLGEGVVINVSRDQVQDGTFIMFRHSSERWTQWCSNNAGCGEKSLSDNCSGADIAKFYFPQVPDWQSLLPLLPSFCSADSLDASLWLPRIFSLMHRLLSLFQYYLAQGYKYKSNSIRRMHRSGCIWKVLLDMQIMMRMKIVKWR